MQYRPSEVSHENEEQGPLDFGCRVGCGDVNRGSAPRRSGARRSFQARVAGVREPFRTTDGRRTAIGAGQGEFAPYSSAANKHGQGRVVRTKCAANCVGSLESCAECRTRAVETCARGLGFSYAAVL